MGVREQVVKPATVVVGFLFISSRAQMLQPTEAAYVNEV